MRPCANKSEDSAFPTSRLAYAPPVLLRLGHILLIIALLTATGGHWAVLQTVAWTNMLATNLSTDSLEMAVTKTFDGNHPCGLCKVISAGKKAEKKSAFPTLAKKLEFISNRPAFVFSPPQRFWLAGERAFAAHPLASPPPLPPPRLQPA